MKRPWTQPKKRKRVTVLDKLTSLKSIWLFLISWVSFPIWCSFYLPMKNRSLSKGKVCLTKQQAYSLQLAGWWSLYNYWWWSFIFVLIVSASCSHSCQLYVCSFKINFRNLSVTAFIIYYNSSIHIMMCLNMCQIVTFVSQVLIRTFYRRNVFVLPNTLKQLARRIRDFQSQIKLNHYQITSDLRHRIIFTPFPRALALKISLIETVCIFL